MQQAYPYLVILAVLGALVIALAVRTAIIWRATLTDDHAKRELARTKATTGLAGERLALFFARAERQALGDLAAAAVAHKQREAELQGSVDNLRAVGAGAVHRIALVRLARLIRDELDPALSAAGRTLPMPVAVAIGLLASEIGKLCADAFGTSDLDDVAARADEPKAPNGALPPTTGRVEFTPYPSSPNVKG